MLNMKISESREESKSLEKQSSLLQLKVLKVIGLASSTCLSH